MKKLNTKGIAEVGHELESAAQKIYKELCEAYEVHLQQTNYELFDPNAFELHLEDWQADRINSIAKLPVRSDGSFTARLVFEFESSVTTNRLCLIPADTCKYMSDIVWRVCRQIGGYPQLQNRFRQVGINGVRFLVDAQFSFQLANSMLDDT